MLRHEYQAMKTTHASLTLAVLFVLVAASSVPGGDAAKKAPVPADAALAEATKVIKEVYGNEYAKAKKTTEKQALAMTLLGKAKDVENDLSGKFVLLRLARDIAMQADDGRTAFQAIDALAEAFQIDALAMKTAALAKFVSAAQKPARHKVIAEQALKLMDQAISEDNFTVAHELGELAFAEARKAFDKEVLAQAKGRVADLAGLIKEYGEVKKSSAQLEKEPTDPAANLAVGKYTCFVKGDWDKGLPMLALGSDEKFKALATQELQGVASSAGQAKLGDEWWSLAEKQDGTAKNQLEGRAAYWYQKALPGLDDGLEMAKVEKRLSQVSASSSPAKNQAASGGFEDNAWKLVFRSSDPKIWNTDVNDKTVGYALSISKVPDDVKYLRLQTDSKRNVVIIPITKGRLLDRSAEGGYGWEGTNRLEYGGYHLGVYNTNTRTISGAIGIARVAARNDRLGWGFGHKIDVNDRQYYSWAGVAIPKTVFEISVKSRELAKAETRFFLK
jgi:hypothetical protein